MTREKFAALMEYVIVAIIYCCLGYSIKGLIDIDKCK